MEIDEYRNIVKGVPACPFGIGIAQNWTQIGSIFSDLVRFDIKLFVELGVFLGGMSELMLLRVERVPGFDYLGTQLDYEQVDKRIAGNPKIKQCDHWTPEIIGEICEKIRTTSGTAMIYCDGGDKPKEMRLYAPILRIGDYLRAHDYPGETSPESLAEFALLFPNMVEIETDKCRELGYTLWMRVG